MWLKRSLVAVVLIGSLAAVAWAQDSTKTAPAPQPAPAQTTTPTPAEPAPAQTTTPGQPMTAAPTAATPEARIEAVKQSLAASKSALKQYEWVETVALTKDGEEKARQQSRCYRDATGAMQRSLIAPDSSKAQEKKKGGLRGKREAKKQGASDATLKAAVQVLHQYMPVDPVKIDAAKGEGHVSVSLPGDDNRVRITIKNYVQPGDEVTLVVDMATNAVKAATVKTSMAAEKGEKSPIVAQVTYGALPDGTLYPANAALDLSAQSIKVDVENTGFKKQAS